MAPSGTCREEPIGRSVVPPHPMAQCNSASRGCTRSSRSIPLCCPRGAAPSLLLRRKELRRCARTNKLSLEPLPKEAWAPEAAPPTPTLRPGRFRRCGGRCWPGRWAVGSAAWTRRCSQRRAARRIAFALPTSLSDAVTANLAIDSADALDRRAINTRDALSGASPPRARVRVGSGRPSGGGHQRGQGPLRGLAA